MGLWRDFFYRGLRVPLPVMSAYARVSAQMTSYRTPAGFPVAEKTSVRAGACAPSDYWNWSSRFLFQVIMVQAP